MPQVQSNTQLVVVPYVRGRLRRETASVVPEATFVDVGSDDLAYWRLLCRLWDAKQTFIIVEHDVVPHTYSIPYLRDCHLPWCAYPYQMGDITTTALGCTKFGSTLLESTEGLVSGILSEHRAWSSLDSMIVGELHRRGALEHVHQPAVLHLHERPEDKPQRCELTKLRYIGDGTRYLNGIPASDFETQDRATLALCLESGLYIEKTSRAKIATSDMLTKFVPFVETVQLPSEPTPEKEI
jgi:hypothetical protein